MPPRPPSVQSDSIMHSSMSQDRGECVGNVCKQKPLKSISSCAQWPAVCAPHSQQLLGVIVCTCMHSSHLQALPQAVLLNKNVLHLPGQMRAGRHTVLCCVCEEVKSLSHNVVQMYAKADVAWSFVFVVFCLFSCFVFF